MGPRESLEHAGLSIELAAAAMVRVVEVAAVVVLSLLVCPPLAIVVALPLVALAALPAITSAIAAMPFLLVRHLRGRRDHHRPRCCTASGGFEVPLRDAQHLPDTQDVQELLHHLDPWPYLHVERRKDCAILRMRDRDVGTLNLVTHALSVNVPPNGVGPMLEGDLPLRRTAGGVSVQVTDIESRTAAETLVRRRVDLERFAWQLRAASP